MESDQVILQLTINWNTCRKGYCKTTNVPWDVNIGCIYLTLRCRTGVLLHPMSKDLRRVPICNCSSTGTSCLTKQLKRNSHCLKRSEKSNLK